MGHARALLAVDDKDLQILIFEKIIEEKLSVRRVEDLIRFNSDESPKEVIKKEATQVSNEEKGMAKDIGMVYGSRVSISKADNGKGKLVFHFDNDKDLKSLIKKLKQV